MNEIVFCMRPARVATVVGMNTEYGQIAEKELAKLPKNYFPKMKNIEK